MKKIIAGTVIFAALFASAAFGADEGITLNIDGEELKCDAAPQITDGRTMVPVREIFEALGADVYWNEDTKTASAVKDSVMVNMTVGSNIMKINGERLEMDISPVITEGRTFIPAKYAAEALGCSAEWDAASKTVNIITPENETEVSEGTHSCTPGITEQLKYMNFNVQPVDYSYMDEESAKIHEKVRSGFEHKYFYEILTEESAETSSGYDEVNDFTVSYPHMAWEAGLNEYINGCISGNEENCSFSGDLGSEDFVNYITNDCLLGSEVNFRSTPKYFNDCSGFYVELAEDRYISSCRYIVVLFDWNGNFRYYTLERAEDNYWNACETTDKGSRIISSFSNDAGLTALRSAFVNTISIDYHNGN